MPSTNNLFQLTFPDGWKETTVYTFEGPHDSGVQHNLVLVISNDLPKKTDLVEWAKQQFGTSKEALPGFEMIQEKQTQLPSGLPCYEIVYRYSPSDQLTYFQKQYYLIIGQSGYIFTATFSKKTLQTIANEVDQIIAGFKPFLKERDE
jgi:hypothetical protein